MGLRPIGFAPVHHVQREQRISSFLECRRAAGAPTAVVALCQQEHRQRATRGTTLSLRQRQRPHALWDAATRVCDTRHLCDEGECAPTLPYLQGIYFRLRQEFHNDGFVTK
jgi:hypothetical protein